MGLLDSWTDGRIEPAVELLLQAAESTGCLGNPTWSIAELGMSIPDLKKLRDAATRNASSWTVILRRNFHYMTHEIRLPERLGTLRPSGRECLGLLSLAILAELSRIYGDTGACFLRCRRELPPALESLLFQGGSLNRFVQPAIEEACHRFRLRFAGPNLSVQRWYLTVRLHEGFPGNNLENRLPSWLHGLGLPLHLSLLLSADTLGSSSLGLFWSKLVKFARKKASRDQTRVVMESSVWFRGQDVEALLDAIEDFSPPAHSSAALSHLTTVPVDEDLQEIEAKTLLRLDVSRKPIGLRARPEAATLSEGLDRERYEVLIEGKWQGALLRGASGQMEWLEEDGWILVPFRSTCTVKLLDEEDRPVEGERSLRVLPEGEVLVFDSTGNAVGGVLEASQGYWLVAPQGATWEGAPAGATAAKREEHCLMWLPPGWGPGTEVRLDEEVLWSSGCPRIPRPPWLAQVVLQENPTNPGQFEVILPPEAQLEAVRLDGRELALVVTRFHLPAQPDPLVDVRIVVRQGPSRWVVSRRVVARGALLLTEATGGWRESAPGEVLDQEELANTTVRVCAPRDKQRLYFGSAMGGKAPQRAGVLTGPPGRGEPLLLGPSSPRSSEDFWPLRVSVVSRGIVQSGGLENRHFSLKLRRKIKNQPEHQVLLWPGNALPVLFPVTWTEDAIELDLPPDIHEVRAAALLYKQSWIGGWWSPDWCTALEPAPEEMVEFFLWLRWLRLPFLEERAVETVRKLACQYPSELLLAWSILPREHDEDSPERKKRLHRLMQLRTRGGPVTPTSLPDGESWRQAVRLLLLETDFEKEKVDEMYSRVHVDALHHPIAQALLPWGTSLLGISERWPVTACHGANYQQQKNADGRRSQWRHAFRHLDPQKVIKPRTRTKALDEMKWQAASALATSLDTLEQMLAGACTPPPHSPAISAALHQEMFRRLVATILLDQGAPA